MGDGGTSDIKKISGNVGLLTHITYAITLSPLFTHHPRSKNRAPRACLLCARFLYRAITAF